ncbi:binding-protein-dependent transport systems inner membrane component [Thioalkalivibrio sulfidiphilus HL-EbGr7]|uniref:Binding-protein-dependent transport systems inner membrane component n=1 Tax=Thioalkalivibrio sulfidiphilus (strain HL-EbGR7) TaxID=396588 RepID=B8GL34_THISH|nr:binding-protein-dependent transport systems inner membrane component [Thioalkalivibrio sulfidiphilus HL-EbGr7]
MNQAVIHVEHDPALPRRPLDAWKAGLVLVALILALPVLVVFAHLFLPATDVWQHMRETVLRDYVVNSLLLMLGVGVGVLLIGIPAAWLVSLCEFPGRRLFQWALLLPLAMPAYIIAYTYTGMLDFPGPVQTQLREWFGWGYGDYWFPEIRSLGGAMVMLSLVLYPYVYLLARAAFLEQSVCVLEVSRTLGNGPWAGFMRVALPLARPAIITGLSLALMETLADYGTVAYFGIPTFTTGIFRTWFGMGDPGAAAQLAGVLMTFVFVLIVLERWSRRRARFHHTSSRYTQLPRYHLKGWRRAAALFVCILPVALGFLLPATQLTVWAVGTTDEWMNTEFLRLTWNSLSLAAIAALLAVALALFMAYGQRLRPSWTNAVAVRVAGMGYAIPGTVIAVGVMLPFAWLDNTVDGWMRASFGISTGLLLSGTLVALIFAYCVRFLAVSLQTVEAALGKIKPSMDDAARSLGMPPNRVLRHVHMPIMRGSLLTALLLVFVDVLKELPATLILRPFNFNTLAVRTFELASDERLADAASAALAIVIAGIIPVILLSRTISRSRPGHDTAA